ncbi:SusC/RagA family TonB-linked outer membrane protein [Algoriphagus winogradskyi]|uniref:TonB-linked outer membrane protein, SusC/RagA family n=1 Tax=Algoriphagus winogradskyi TaxID=237017 RepID=A0ABY1PFV9_9BACT|nr:SusC/RagA family TonB-linked outer membrane protein [Algoriphagus winogradskyi]SMP33482.1 TonB-linked outer membrane protein, SusC/RagA family [Algoriphagus winogradskyi]
MKYISMILLVFAIFIGKSQAYQQTLATLRGTVTDRDGLSLPGALIYLQDTQYRTITNEEGEFELEVAGVDYTLVVSYIGMKTKEMEITLPLSEPLLIRLTSSETELNTVEIVSTGYQSLPKERATGSFSYLDSQLVQRRVSTSVLDRLEDVTPGLIFNRGKQAVNEPVTIRGRSTIFSDTSPLIIVDNFPYDGPLENINPNDVASITVLKDAAAASIWGARAGNGVIVITTVKGAKGQPLKVSFNTNVTLTAPRDLYYVPQMSIPEFIGIEEQLFSSNFYRSLERNSNKPSLSPTVETLIAERDGLLTGEQADQLLELYRQADLRNDVNEYYLQSGISQQYSLSLSGGSDSHAYQVSLGYDQIRSGIVGNSNNRWTLAMGDEWQTLSDKLKVGISLNISNQNSLVGTEIPGGYAYDRLADEQGNPLPIAKFYSTRFINSVSELGLLDWEYRPLNEIGQLDHRTQAYDIRVSPSIQYSITPELKLGVFYQYWKNINSTRDRDPLSLFATRDLINKYSQVGDDGNYTYPLPQGEVLNLGQSDTYSHTFRPQLSFVKDWEDTHFLNAIAGMEIRDLQGLNSSTAYYGYRDDTGISLPVDLVSRFPLFYNPGQQASIPSEDSHGGRVDRFISYYANVGYDLKHRYFLTLSARKDQANIFGVESNKRGVPLWSMGAGWILSDEKFADFPKMPFLKLRATYGVSGNVDKSLSSAVTARYITFLPWDILPQLTASGIVNPPNPGLSWEKIQTTNLALDVETQNGFLAGSIEYYIKDSRDLLGDYSVEAATGNTNFTGNFAASRINGADLSLAVRWFRNDFQWTSNLFYSGVNEKVTDFEKLPTVSNLLAMANTSMPYPYAGRPLYGIYSYKWAGLDPDTGDPLGFVDGEASNDYLAISRESTIENLQYHGPARPTSFGAFRNDFGYKGFALSVNISYRFGYYYSRESINYYTLLRGTIGHGDYDRRWQQPGDEEWTQVPSLPASSDTRRNNFYMNSGALVEKGDHIRLNDVRFSYTLSSARMPRLPFHSAEFYSYASNLGILWKASDDALDPDFQTSRPLRSFALGMRLDF